MNAINHKADKAADYITLLVVATASDCETYSNLATTVASLTSKLSSANKNIVVLLRYNVFLGRFLVQCGLGGRTSKKRGREYPSLELTTSVRVDKAPATLDSSAQIGRWCM